MPEIGVVRAPQPIPDINQLQLGQRPSTPTFFLRAAPPAFIVLNVGGNNSNMNMAFRAATIPPPLLPPSLLAPRISKGARPSGLTIEFASSIAGTGTVSPGLVLTRVLATAIAGAGSVVSNFVRPLRSLASSVAGTGTVVADLSGGTLGGTLPLTPEDPPDLLTVSEETGDSLSLTPEDPSDSLPLTPA